MRECVTDYTHTSVLGFQIVDTFEGPGTWYDALTEEFGSSNTINVANDQYGIPSFGANYA